MTSRERERAKRGRFAVQRDRTVTEWEAAWLNAVGASGARPATLKHYTECLARMVKAVGDLPIREVTPEMLEAWQADQATRCKPSSVNRVLATCNTFFRWVEDEGGLGDASRPTLYVDRLPERDSNPAVLDAAVRRKMAKAAKVTMQGRSSYEAARDVAILSLLEDTGLRASECAGLLLDNLDLRGRQAYVHADIAKGGRDRTVVFGFETAKVLDRYLRLREQHRYAFCPQVFLSKAGPASYSVVWQCVKNASRRAGVIGARPHLYRHTFAHELKRAGAPDEVLMSLAGWSNTTQLRRYGRAERTARAIETYQRLGSVVDRGSIDARKVKAAEDGARLSSRKGRGQAAG